MAQKIKRKIKRSLPGLIILCLISSLIVGLAFNNLNWNLKIPLVKAQNNDTATTSVTVRNAPPTFNSPPAENPISSSTSPVNYGASINFTVTGDDPEGAQYYLLVCSTNSASAHNGAVPTCGGTQRCISALTNDMAQASCTYTNVQDASETQDWYAFVCDAHASEAECSSANQGSGESGSPLYVNHAPDFTAVATTQNNQAPGGTFTFTATAVDADVQGGDDGLIMHVCSTNSFATSTGCAATTFCSTPQATSTSNPYCSWIDTAPTPDQNYTYYAFVMDWHMMASSSNSQTNTYTVINVAPSISNTILDANRAGGDITPNMKNMAANTVYASTTSVTDQNGCTDVRSATSTFYLSSATNGANCSNSTDDCYQVSAVNCWFSDCSGNPETDAALTVTCSTSMAFYATVTDATSNNPWTGSNWLARIAVGDEAATTTDTTATPKEINAISAIEVQQLTIPYGTVRSNQNTGDYNATTTVENYGNVPMDATIEGDNMLDPFANTIEVYYQRYSTSTFIWPNPTQVLTNTTTPNLGLVLKRPDSAEQTIIDDAYWGIGIPTRPSGTYTGTNTFYSDINESGDWNN